MGPFGIPWPIAWIYISAYIIIPILIEITIRSKWWDSLSNYYYSFNQISIRTEAQRRERT